VWKEGAEAAKVLESNGEGVGGVVSRKVEKKKVGGAGRGAIVEQLLGGLKLKLYNRVTGARKKKNFGRSGTHEVFVKSCSSQRSW